MPSPRGEQPNPAAMSDHFLTTHWSLVSAAGKDDTKAALDALEALCRAYWYPLYAYVRRRGHAAPDAQDLTQGFFAKLLSSDGLSHLDRRKGRFRAFLLASLKHYLTNQWDHATAQKRGGGTETIALDAVSAENRYDLEPVDEFSPERLYERRWALTVIDQVLAALTQEYATLGNATLFTQLRPTLPGGTKAPKYADIAARTGMSEGAVKVAVHRLRQRFRRLLQEQIAATVAAPEDVEDEVRHLLKALT
jgi:RNA polymerase sigma factor (sigma-70 family)